MSGKSSWRSPAAAGHYAGHDLADFAARRDQSQSMIAEAAIASFLSPDDAERREAIVGAVDAVADLTLDVVGQLLEELHRRNRLGVAPGAGVWFVGDTGVDMQAARAAGCSAVLLGDAGHDGGIATAAPDLHFPDGDALAAALLALAKG